MQRICRGGGKCSCCSSESQDAQPRAETLQTIGSRPRSSSSAENREKGKGNLTDLVGDMRFFFSLISSRVEMVTWRFNNIFVFKLWALDYPLLKSPNQIQVAAVIVKVHRKADDDPERSFASRFPRSSIFSPFTNKE